MPRSRLTVRRAMAAFGIAAFTALTLWCLWPGGFTIKVVNRTGDPMTEVRLVLGDGSAIELASIPPGESAVAVLSRAGAADVRLVYRQPDGLINDSFRAGFRPGSHPLRENKAVLGIMAHMIKGNPNTMRGYVQRRSIFDPAKYLPFAPGAGD